MTTIPSRRLTGPVALAGAALILAPLITGASAAPQDAPSRQAELEPSALVTAQQWADALQEAHQLGYVSKETTANGGVTTTTIDLGRGFTFDVVDGPGNSDRLWAGSDGYGKYVAFNATDQNAIISGAAFGLGAGLCVVSAGTFCVVAGAIITAATIAVTSNGIRCGTKALRVYPFSGHKPRCA